MLTLHAVDVYKSANTAPTPDEPGKLAYQVDVFHNLHCLVRASFLVQLSKTANIFFF